jgi:hypothetical protein
MKAGTRVKIVESADYPETQGFFGVVDPFGLKFEGRGYVSGGIGLDKLGYYFYPFVKVEEKK